MPGVVIGHIGDVTFDAVSDHFRRWHPGLRFLRGAMDGEQVLRPEQGVRYLWLESGSGRAFLPRGTRTQEGDGEPLTADYVPDAVEPDVMAAFDALEAHVDSFHPAVKSPVGAILARRREGHVVGDIAGEVWLILESGVHPQEWTPSLEAKEALELLFPRFRTLGWSEKMSDGWEPVASGDQLTASPERPLRFAGRLRYWCVQTGGEEPQASPARRLRHLRDTAGGCNFAFDAFRRLPMTWASGTGTADNPDGVNVVNSHVVHIAAETSQTHYHPIEPVGGGKPQSEMYLVLDPSVFGLQTHGRSPFLVVFPELHDLSRYEKLPLRPGSTIYIEPETGHRGLDAFVNVVTLPGFKPRNEVYLDQKIRDTTDGGVPYNAGVTV